MPRLALSFLLFVFASSAGGVAAAPAKTEHARKNYRLYCMGCHLPDGRGAPEKGVPDMRGEVGRFLSLPEGRAYLSQVPGTLNTPLNDGETADLLNWVLLNLGMSSTPPDFQRYTAEDVARYRATVPDDIPGLRIELLERLNKP